MRPARRVALVLAVLLPVLTLGCHRSSRGHVHVEAAPVDFVYQAVTFGETFEDEFEWFNPFDEALVDLSAAKVDGDLFVTIEDSLGVEVYHGHFFGLGGDLVVKDKTFFGLPGTWTIRISGIDLSSDFELFVYP